MKKLFCLASITTILLLTIISVQAQLDIDPTNPNDPLGTGIPSDYIENPEEGFQDIKNKTETGFDYLSKEWKSIFLKNKIISAIDSFFTKITWVFRILFGQHYSFSGILFIVIILWLFFFFNIYKIFLNFGILSGETSLGASLGIAIIFGQAKILQKITEFFIWLTLRSEASWARFFILVLIIVSLIAISVVHSMLGKKIKEATDKAKQEKENAEEKAEKTKEKAARNALDEMWKNALEKVEDW